MLEQSFTGVHGIWNTQFRVSAPCLPAPKVTGRPPVLGGKLRVSHESLTLHPIEMVVASV